MDAVSQSEELRANPRYGCAGDAEIVLPGRGLRYAGRIGDLSLSGCFIEVGCRLERGTCVEVWMNARGQPLRVAANLLVQRPTGVGLRFLGVPARKQEQIRSLIAELAEEVAARTAAEVEGEAGSGAAGGLHVVETPLQQMEEPALEAARTQAAGNLWQRWWKRWKAWLSR